MVIATYAYILYAYIYTCTFVSCWVAWFLMMHVGFCFSSVTVTIPVAKAAGTRELAVHVKIRNCFVHISVHVESQMILAGMKQALQMYRRYVRINVVCCVGRVETQIEGKKVGVLPIRIVKSQRFERWPFVRERNQ